ncbi:MAG: hypothetical protein ACK456_02795 [Pseudanabaenaceae cyanobacterium]|jgi:hypothetical protein
MTGIHPPKPQTSPQSMAAQQTASSQGSQGNGGVSPSTASVPISVYRELANELQTAQAKLSFFQLQNEQLMRQNQQLIQSFENINQEMQRMQMLLSQSSHGNPAHLSEVIAALKSMPGNGGLGSDRDNLPLPTRNGKPKPAAPQSHGDGGSGNGSVNVTAQMVQDAVFRAQQIASQQAAQQLPMPHTAYGQPRPSDINGTEDRGTGFSVDPSSPIQPMVMLKDNTVPKPKAKTTAKPAAPKSPKPVEKAAPRSEVTPVDNEDHTVGGWWLALTVLLIVLTSFGAGYFLMRPFVNSTVNHGTPSQSR